MTKTAEEMLRDLMYTTYNCNHARLLLIMPKGAVCSMRDERDLTKLRAFAETEETELVSDDSLDEKDITILKDKIAEGYIPVGVVSVDISHPQRQRWDPSGYFSPEETARSFGAYALGVYAQYVEHDEWAKKNPRINLLWAQSYVDAETPESLK